MTQIVEWLDRMSLVLFLSLFGGVALAAKNKETTFRGVFCCCLVALFTGMVTADLMNEVAQYMPVSENLKNASVSLAAFSGGTVLENWIGRMSRLVEAVFGKTPKP